MTESARPRTILIADDDPDLAQALAVRCRALGHATEYVPDGVRALLRVRRSPPDLLLLDVHMPEADGLRVFKCLADRSKPMIPVIILTGREFDAEIEECLSLGARYCRKGENTWNELKPMIDEVMSASPAERRVAAPAPGVPRGRSERAKVLLVDDDRDFVRALETRLEKLGLDVLKATNGMEAFKIALRERPDAIVTDFLMPEAGGDYLLVRLMNSDFTRHIPVIVVSGQRLDPDSQMPHERHIKSHRGAAAYLRKPIDSIELLNELRKVVRIDGPPF